MLSVAPGETAIVNTLSGPFPPQLNVCMFPNPVVVPEYGETRLERPTSAQPDPEFPVEHEHVQLPVLPPIVPLPLTQYSRPLLPLSLAVPVATHELAVWHVEPE